MTTNSRPPGSGWLRTLEALSLGALLVFTLTAIGGYAVFALHPQLIPDSDSARAFFGQSFELFARAHILVAAVGRPNMITGDWLKPGAVVIDVGINRIETEVDGEKKSRLTGDVEFEGASNVARAVTPVPGGVGPMTIVMLMANTLRAARLSVGLDG